MAKGKLIVLEGIDGSGKSAQYRRLCARFDEAGMAYHHIVLSLIHISEPTRH